MPVALSGLQGRLIGCRGVYRYILPHPLLRPFIAHYTLTLPGRSGLAPRLTLLPDASGCMVFKLGKDGVESRYWGPTTRAVVVENDLEGCVRFFVEFLPGGAFCLTGLPQAALCDLRAPLDAIFPAARRALSGALLESMDAGEWVRRTDAFFLRRLEEGRIPEAQQRLCALVRVGGYTAVGMAEELGYSLRHIGRLARPVLGMGPKAYEQLCRFNRAVSLLKGSGRALAALCQDAGYYDQPHFIHDFKLVTGKTPTEYLQNLSGFYNEELKFSAIL